MVSVVIVTFSIDRLCTNCTCDILKYLKNLLSESYSLRTSMWYSPTSLSMSSVCLSVCLSQTAGRNSCSIVSGNVSNCSHRLTVSCHEFASQFGLAFYLYAKNFQNLWSVYFNESPIGHCLASVGKDAPNNDGVMVGRTETATVVCGGVRVRECARAYVRACVHAWCVCNIRW